MCQCQHVIHNNSFSDLVYRQFAFVVASLTTSLRRIIGATIDTTKHACNYLIRTFFKDQLYFASLSSTHRCTHTLILHRLADVFSKYCISLGFPVQHATEREGLRIGLSTQKYLNEIIQSPPKMPSKKMMTGSLYLLYPDYLLDIEK